MLVADLLIHINITLRSSQFSSLHSIVAPLQEQSLKSPLTFPTSNFRTIPVIHSYESPSLSINIFHAFASSMNRSIQQPRRHAAGNSCGCPIDTAHIHSLQSLTRNVSSTYLLISFNKILSVIFWHTKRSIAGTLLYEEHRFSTFICFFHNHHCQLVKKMHSYLFFTIRSVV